jgi:hypothetical protein
MKEAPKRHTLSVRLDDDDYRKLRSFIGERMMVTSERHTHQTVIEAALAEYMARHGTGGGGTVSGSASTPTGSRGGGGGGMEFSDEAAAAALANTCNPDPNRLFDKSQCAGRLNDEPVQPSMPPPARAAKASRSKRPTR